MLFISFSSKQYENLSDKEKELVIEEISDVVNKTDFFIEATKYAKVTNLSFYRYDYVYDSYDHYHDVNMKYLKEQCDFKCGIFCCKSYWEKINIFPLSSKMANINGVLCYEIVTNKGIIYCGKKIIKCDLCKENEIWTIKTN